MFIKILASVMGALIGAQFSAICFTRKDLAPNYCLSLTAQSGFICGMIGSLALLTGACYWHIGYVYCEFALCLAAAFCHYRLFDSGDATGAYAQTTETESDHACCDGGCANDDYFDMLFEP